MEEKIIEYLCLTKDKKTFIELYPDTSNKKLGILFNRAKSTIQRYARKYKVSKSDHYMENQPSRYKLGNVPDSKDKKGIHNSPATEFKPGHVPVNHKPVGTISIRNNTKRNHCYKYIKIAEMNVWKEYHLYIYEKEYSPIPKGEILIFRDGNSMNFVLKNLELINAQKHMDRNRNYPKMSNTLRELWKKEKWRVKYGIDQQTKLRINNVNCYN